MSQNPGGHEFSPIDSLGQNNALRQTIKLLPRRSAGEDMAAAAQRYMEPFRRMLRKDSSEYYPVLREQFATRLAVSYATPGLQRYALQCFEGAYILGMRNSVGTPLSRCVVSNLSEYALLALAASDNPASPGLYDPQTAKEIEQTLYRYCAEPTIQEIRELIYGERVLPVRRTDVPPGSPATNVPSIRP